MVRFIIYRLYIYIENKPKFTFQYGQIYYKGLERVWKNDNKIYIPIWLDLLSKKQVKN